MGYVLQQVLTAVCYMHAHCVCHRGLDVQKLLLLEAGEPLFNQTVVVGDFELAVQLAPEGRNKLKEDIGLFGCMYNMAPEVLRCEYTELCDLWSCGVCAYTLLCGELPFADADRETLLERYDKGVNFVSAEDVPDVAQELILALLSTENLRPTARRALMYPWLQRSHKDSASMQAESIQGKKETGMNKEKYQLKQETFQKICQFSKHDEVKKKVLQVIAHRLQDNELRELGKEFLALDSNHDGVVTIDELKHAIQNRGKHRDATDLDAILNAMDSNGNNFIEYTEFLAAAMDERRIMQEGLLWMAFRYFDSDGDGTITRQELLKTLGNDDTQRSMADADFRDLYADVSETLAKFDANRDGNIDFDEFVVMMCGMRKDKIRTVPNTLHLVAKPGRRSSILQGVCSKCKENRKLRKTPDGIMLCNECFMNVHVLSSHEAK